MTNQGPLTHYEPVLLDLPINSSVIRAAVNPAAHAPAIYDAPQVVSESTSTSNTNTTTTTTTPTKRPASPNIKGKSPEKRQKTAPCMKLSPVKYPVENNMHSTVLLGPSGFGAFGLELDTRRNCLCYVEDVGGDVLV